MKEGTIFESSHIIRTTRFAMECPQLQQDYLEVWRGLKKNFEG